MIDLLGAGVDVGAPGAVLHPLFCQHQPHHLKVCFVYHYTVTLSWDKGTGYKCYNFRPGFGSGSRFCTVG